MIDIPRCSSRDDTSNQPAVEFRSNQSSNRFGRALTKICSGGGRTCPPVVLATPIFCQSVLQVRSRSVHRRRLALSCLGIGQAMRRRRSIRSIEVPLPLANDPKWEHMDHGFKTDSDRSSGEGLRSGIPFQNTIFRRGTGKSSENIAPMPNSPPHPRAQARAAIGRFNGPIDGVSPPLPRSFYATAAATATLPSRGTQGLERK